jgi:cell division septum initiation protein DivIVA
MTIVTTEFSNEVSFRTRPLGYDRKEVRAFIANVLDDCGRAVRELERLRAQFAALDTTAERRAQSEATAREVERILGGAQRIAADVEAHAKDESARRLAEATGRAAEIVTAAEHRAAQIVDEAVKRAARIEEQAAALKAQCLQLRGTFAAAAETAAAGLAQIAGVDDGRSRTIEALSA